MIAQEQEQDSNTLRCPNVWSVTSISITDHITYNTKYSTYVSLPIHISLKC